MDTAPDLITALNYVLDREGLPPVPLASARNMIGAGARKLIERGPGGRGPHRHAGRDRPADGGFHRLLRRPYRRRIRARSRGSMDALDDLCGAAAIVSRSAPTSWNGCRSGCWTSSDLSARFAAICGADTFGVAKPDPAILPQTVARAGGEVKASIMVGDAGTDVGVARRAGVPVIGVSFGYTDVPIADLKPDRLIHHMRDLPAAAQSLMMTA